MKLVVDTNVVMSALIADSVTRTLLMRVNDRLVAPEMLKRELERHDDLLRERSGLTEAELDVLRAGLFAFVELVPDADLDAYREEAEAALADVDPDDVIFLATAMAVDGVIWSDDRHFQDQDLVPVVTTEDVVDEFEAASEE